MWPGGLTPFENSGVCGGTDPVQAPLQWLDNAPVSQAQDSNGSASLSFSPPGRAGGSPLLTDFSEWGGRAWEQQGIQSRPSRKQMHLVELGELDQNLLLGTGG